MASGEVRGEECTVGVYNVPCVGSGDVRGGGVSSSVYNVPCVTTVK